MHREINVDMDGVLTDFDGYYTQLTGCGWPHMMPADKEEKWAALKPFPNFFLDMPWYPGSKDLWNFLVPFQPRILSAASNHVPQSADQKKQWCKRELDLEGDDRVRIVSRKREKVPYAKPGAILIDDSPINIRRWDEAGGMGILFTNVSSTLHELQVILCGQ